MGGEAIALGSTANKKVLLSMPENQKTKNPLIIALDNDESGRNASRELSDGLQGLEIPFYMLDIAKPHNDVSEPLRADREDIRFAIEQTENIETEILKAQR